MVEIAVVLMGSAIVIFVLEAVVRKRAKPLSLVSEDRTQKTENRFQWELDLEDNHIFVMRNGGIGHDLPVDIGTALPKSEEDRYEERHRYLRNGN